MDSEGDRFWVPFLLLLHRTRHEFVAILFRPVRSARALGRLSVRFSFGRGTAISWQLLKRFVVSGVALIVCLEVLVGFGDHYPTDQFHLGKRNRLWAILRIKTLGDRIEVGNWIEARRARIDGCD